MELTREDARYLLDGITTMASESYSPSDFSTNGAQESFEALCQRLIAIAELTSDELELFDAIVRPSPATEAAADLLHS